MDSEWGCELHRVLEQRRLPEPWFLFLHIWELHWPRRAPGSFNDARYGDSLYQRSVAYVDHLLGQLLDRIDLNQTVIVITGDHGEGVAGAIDRPSPMIQLGVQWAYRLTRRLPTASKKRILTLGKRFLLERREPPAERIAPKAPRPEVAGHAALCVYDYLARVPLVIAAPGRLPARWIDYQVRHVDIAPTVVDLAGIRPDPHRWSPPLAVMARDQGILDRPSITEALQTMLHDPIRRLIGYRTGRHKLIYAPENPDVPPELYNLEVDPGELDNLAPDMPELVAQLRRQAEDEQKLGSPNGAMARMTTEEEAAIRQRLEQLGYIE